MMNLLHCTGVGKGAFRRHNNSIPVGYDRMHLVSQFVFEVDLISKLAYQGSDKLFRKLTCHLSLKWKFELSYRGWSLDRCKLQLCHQNHCS